MVKLTTQADGTIAISGKTFDHKETLKQMGARWQPREKCWVITNTPEHMKQLKSLKTARRCGHCGETGHFKPACKKYHDERKLELQKRANALWEKPGWKFKRFAHTKYCYCMFESEDFGYKDFSVLMPVTCGPCSSWCCQHACPMEGDVDFNPFRFDCKIHGNSIEQMLNDTRGT
jgi:hypothetical protein